MINIIKRDVRTLPSGGSAASLFFNTGKKKMITRENSGRN